MNNISKYGSTRLSICDFENDIMPSLNDLKDQAGIE